MIRAVCIGEPMVELRPSGSDSLVRAVAGDAYNTAAYLRRCLAPGDEVSLLTVLGEDSLSAGIATDIRAQGVDDRLVFTDPDRLPGLYLIELDARGERGFRYWRGESAAKLWMSRLAEGGGAEVLAGVDLVFLTGISLAILSPRDRDRALELMAALRGRVGRIAFDPNIRPILWAGDSAARSTLATACGLADLVLASEADTAWIWPGSSVEQAIGAIRELGCPEVVVTLGERGVHLSQKGSAYLAPAPAATVTDTSGAGDSFNAAYLAARCAGLAPDIAAARGQALAARVVAHPGALIPAALSHPSSTSSPGTPP